MGLQLPMRGPATLTDLHYELVLLMINIGRLEVQGDLERNNDE